MTISKFEFRSPPSIFNFPKWGVPWIVWDTSEELECIKEGESGKWGINAKGQLSLPATTKTGREKGSKETHYNSVYCLMLHFLQNIVANCL